MKNLITRAGCQDIWNAFMVEGAIFSKHDIPFCPTTAKSLPNKLVSYVTAKQIYKQELSLGNTQFHNEAFVHFCIHDYVF